MWNRRKPIPKEKARQMAGFFFGRDGNTLPTDFTVFI